MKNIEKIFGILATGIYVLVYLFLTIHSGHFHILTTFIHIPFLIASTLLLSALLAQYKWVNNEYYLAYSSLSMIINGLCLFTFYNLMDWNVYYMPVLTELICTIVIVGLGIIIGVCLSLPLKFIQMFFYETALYGDDDVKINKKRNIADRYKAILSTMNETQLNAELLTTIGNEEYEKAALIREELKKFK